MFSTKNLRFIKSLEKFILITILIGSWVTFFFLAQKIKSLNSPKPKTISWNSFENLKINLGIYNAFIVETRTELKEVDIKSLCAAESFARHNPGHDVYFIVSTKHSISFPTTIEHFISNLIFAKIDDENFFNNTSLEGNTNKSITDLLLPLVLVYKYGGIHLDAATITLRPFSEIPKNFLPLYKNSIANTTLQFEPQSFYLKKIIDNGNTNSINSSQVLKEKTADEICSYDQEFKGQYSNYKCENITFLPDNCFYPIDSYEDFYDELKTEEIKNRTVNSYGIHYWLEDFFLAKTHPIYQIYQENCPIAEKTVLKI